MKTPLFRVNGRLTRVSRIFVRLFTMAALLGSVLSASATTYTRQNNATKLDLVGAWSGGPPGSGDIALWDITAAAANCTNGTTLNVSLSWGGMALGATAPGGNVVIPASGTSVLTLGSSGINWVSVATARNLTIVCPVTAGASQPWSVGTGRVLTVQTGATTLGSNNLTFDGAGTAYINSIITGDGTISLNNAAGTLVLGGANTATFTGPVTNSAGILKVASAGGLGSTASGTTIADGAALDINAAVGAEPVSVAGKGVGDNGALRNSSNTVAGILGGVVTLTGDTYVGVLGTTNLTLGGQVTGGYALTRVGTGIGKLYLGNTANDYTGGTAISNGVLVASNSTLPAGCLTINGAALAAFESQDASFVRALGTGDDQVNIPGGVSGFNGGAANSAINIGSGSALTWGSGGFSPVTFVLNSSLAPFPVDFQNNIDLGASVRKVQVESAGRAATMSGNLTGTGGGGLEKLGAGHLILSGNNSYDGVTKVTGGTLTFAGPDAIPGGIGASGGASALTLSGVLGLGDSDFLRGLGAGADQVQWGPANGGFAAVNADRVVNLGGASAALAWNSGGFVSNTFALVLGSTFATHTVDFQNPIDLGSSARTVQADNGTAAVDALISGQITGAGGALTKGGVGTLRLTHAGNSYSGGTILGGGTLSFASGALGGSGPISQTVASGLQWFGENTEDLSSRLSVGTLVATIDSNTNNITFASTLGGTTGGLTKNGAGTLTLTATNKYAGATTVSGGTLQYGIDNALGLGVVTVSGAGSVLDMGSYTDAVGVVTLSAGSILGSGTLASSGAFTMSPAGAVTCSVALAGGTASTLTKTGAGTLTLSNPSSTFAGKTTISAGSYVEIVTLANLGSSCSLGQPTILANGTIALGVTTTAGGLRYIGAGDSISDRVINLNGTSGGATLDVTGTGNLTLTSALTASGAGSKVLTLMGAGPGMGTLPGTIVNNSAANKTGVSKFGFGTWVLGGTNTYTGVNTFNGGVLSVGFIADGGVACNIGQAATNAANLLLGGGTLRFTANAGSYSTDRSFTLTAATRSTIDVTNEAATLTLNGGNTATTGGLNKDGAGTLALSGTYLHTGATIVSNGTLRITGSLAGLSPVSIGAGATLDGSGLCAGAVSNYATGRLAAGVDGVAGQSLTVGRLTLLADSATAFEFSAFTNDTIVVTNSAGLALNGGGVYLYAEGTTNAWSTDGVYKLIQYTGALTGSVANLSALNPAAGKTCTIGVSGGWVVAMVGSAASANVWDGGSTADDNWLSADNWASDSVPATNAGLTFAGATRTVNTNNYPAGMRFGDLVFDANAAAFTLAGNAVDLAGDVRNNSANAQTIGLPLTLKLGSRTFDAASNNITLGGVLDDGGEANGFVKTGPNTLTLAGSNSFAGAVAVNAGALVVQDNDGLGTTAGGVTVADSAALQLQGGIAVGAEPLNLSGTGLANDGALRNIQDDNTYGGLITLAGASLIKADAGTLTLDVAAGNAIASTATNVTFGGAGAITVADPIAIGAGALTKNDAGTLTLSGANSFTGLTTVNAGTLQYGATNALLTGAVTINGGTLDMADYSDSVGLVTMTNGAITASAGSLASTVGFVFEEGTVSSPLAGAVGVTKNTAGTVILSRSNTFTGVSRLNEGILRATTSATSLGTGAATLMLGAGELQLANDTPLGFARNTTVTNDTTVTSDRMSLGAGVFHTNGTLSIGSFTLNVGAGGYATSGTGAVVFGASTLTGNSTFNVMTNGSGADTLLTLGALGDGAVARTMTKSGPGALTLVGAATLVNGTLVRVTEGRLNANLAGALGLLAVVDVADDTIFSLSDAQTLGGLSNTNSALNSGSVVINGAYALRVGGTNNLDSAFSGVISGASGQLTKAGLGTLTLSGVNTYGGLTSIGAGTLLVTNGAGSATGTGIVNVNSAGTLAGVGTCSGVVSNKLGGTVAPGVPGTAGGILTVGSLSLVAGATNVFEFAAAPAANDQIAVATSGGLTITGGDVLLVAEGTTNTWETPGAYTLAQYNGPLIGTPASLTMKNPGADKTYVFDVVEGAPNRLVVTIGNTKTWSGASGDNANWTTAENWTGGAPMATDLVAFAGNGGNWLTNNNDLAAGTRLDGIFFNSGSSAFRLGGNLVNLHGSVVNNSTNLQILDMPLALDEGSRSIHATSGSVSVLGAVSEVNGAGSLAKFGAGALTLAGANTFSGGVIFNAGTLNLNSASALGTGTLTINGGTLDNTSAGDLVMAGDNAQAWNAGFTFKGTAGIDMGAGAVALNTNISLITQSTNDLAVRGVISGPYRLTKAVATGYLNSLTLGDANTFSGGLTLSGGTLRIGTLANGGDPSSIGASDSSAANFVLGGGYLFYTGGTCTIDRNISLSADTRFDILNPLATLTVLGNITNTTGAAGFVSTSSGTLELRGADSHLGGFFQLSGGYPGMDGRSSPGYGTLLANGPVRCTTMNITYGNTLGGTGSVSVAGKMQVINGYVAPGINGVAGGTLTVNANPLILSNSSNRLIFEFNALTNDTIVTAVSEGLSLNMTNNVYLLEEGTTNAWKVNGEYRLIQYAGSLSAGGPDNLAVANPAADTSYAFFLADNWIMVRITGPFGPVWDGGGSDDNWSTMQNWNPDSALDLYAGLVFAGTTRLNNTNDYAGLTNGGLYFADAPLAAGSFTLGGNGITIAGSVVNNSAVPQTIDLPLELAVTTRTFNAASGDLIVNGAVSDGGNTNGILKLGGNTLTLNGANTYAGLTTVRAGALRAQNADALGAALAGTVVSNGAALQLQGGVTIAGEPLVLNGLGVASNGALRNMQEDNTYGGPITLGSAARVNSDAGTLTLNAVDPISNVFNLSFGGSGTTLVSTAINTGIGTLSKDGSGALVLGAANSYTGLTTVSDGTLAYGCDDALASGAITISGSNAVLDVGGFSDTVGMITLSAGAITGSGTLNMTTGLTSSTSASDPAVYCSAVLAGPGFVLKGGSGDTYTYLTGTNTYTGGTHVQGGILSVDYLADGGQPSGIGASSSAEENVIVNSATLEYTGPSVTINRDMMMTYKLKLLGVRGYEKQSDYDAGFIRIAQPGTTLTLTGALTSNTNNLTAPDLPASFFYKSGPGTLELAGINRLVGFTSVEEGTLKVSGSIPSTNDFWDSTLCARYPLAVDSNATVSGDGEIGPSVTVYAEGTIAPGRDTAGAASLTVGGLTFQENSIAVFEFTGDPANDTIVLTGSDNLSLAPVKVYLFEDATTNAWSSNGVYNLIQYAGALREGDPALLYVANPVEGKSYTFTMSGGWVTLTIGDASIWDGGGSDDNWTTSLNWLDDIAPSSGKSLTFAGALRLTNANDFAAGTPFGEIVFDATAEPFALGGNAVNLQGNVVNFSTNAQTIGLPLVLVSADRAFNTASNDIRVNGLISDGGGTLGLRKAGPYTLTLAGANTYGGETHISWGAVQLGASGSIPNGSGKGDLNVAFAGDSAFDLAGYDETINGLKGAGYVLNSTNTATLTLGDNDATATSSVQFVEYGGVLSLAKIGSGTQVLNGGLAIGGAVTVNAGTLELGAANTCSGAFTVSGGSLRIANTNGSATGTGAVTVESGAALEGTGILSGSALALEAGSAINPGVGGTGTLTVDDLAWADGVVYNCDVTDLTGGAGEGYDGLVANGIVGPATAGDKLVIRLDSNGQTLMYPTNATISLRVLTANAMSSLDVGDYTLETNDFLVDGDWVLTNIADSIYIYHAGISQTNVWVGSGSWSTGTNWSSGAVPAAGDVVVFDGTSSGDCAAGFNSVNDPFAGFILDTGYTGTVTFAKKAASGGMTLAVTGDLAVNSGNLAFQGDPEAIGGGTVEIPHGVGYTIQAANITVASGASLNVDNGGFGSQSGPGKAYMVRRYGIAIYTFGASHGGYGGITPSFTNPVPRYGSLYGPTELGSGGELSGGGALRLKASGTVTVNGLLSASATGSITNGPGGSGGSIWIDGGVLEGSGMIRANGMNTYHATMGAGGGGGRIDLSSTTNNFAGGLEVLGGYGFYSTGTPTSRTLRRGLTGSIVLPQTAGTGLTLGTFTPYTNLVFGNSLTFGSVRITNGVTVKVQAYDDETVVTCGTLTVESNGAFVCMGDYFAVNAANGGTPNNPYGEGVKVVASNITIEAGGSLNANNEGFPSGKYMPTTTGVGALGSGPGGAGTYNVSAASYGGQPGGNTGTPLYSDVMKRAPIYGTVYGPTALGSAGNQHDFNGGGAIKLEVLDTITVDGVLSADATHAPNTASSGGSLWISSGTLAGGGRISCNGGPGASGVSAGGGGRLDISGTVNNFTGILQAQGGVSPTAFGRGQAGSVALPASGGSSGASLDAFTPYGTNFVFGNSVTFGDAVIPNGVLLTLDANEGQNVFTFNSLTIQSGGVVRCLGNLLAVNAAGGGLTNDIRGIGVAIVVSNLTIEAGGSLNSDGRGFDSAVLPAARPVNAAGYGGLAGGGLGRSYGTISNVTVLGCGSNVCGGGAIRIVASGTVSVDGVVSCDGAPTNAADGGSGGSLWIECNTLQGAGRLSASGSGATNKVGGGGGRIHVAYDAVGSPDLIGNGGVVAFGGASLAASKGAAGTVLLVNRGSTESLGTLVVANDVPANNTVTPLPTNENLTVDRVYVKANGALQLPPGMTLGVTTVFSNSAVFAAGANSTVELVGTNDAVVGGSSTFETLRIADAGKTVRFEAGQTTTVREALTLDQSTLLSTEDGSPWYLTCSNSAVQNVGLVRVKDSNAGGGATIVVTNRLSTNLGNNVNWRFPYTGVLIILR